jgi:hypothetical protein
MSRMMVISWFTALGATRSSERSPNKPPAQALQAPPAVPATQAQQTPANWELGRCEASAQPLLENETFDRRISRPAIEAPGAGP